MYLKEWMNQSINGFFNRKLNQTNFLENFKTVCKYVVRQKTEDFKIFLKVFDMLTVMSLGYTLSLYDFLLCIFYKIQVL